MKRQFIMITMVASLLVGMAGSAFVGQANAAPARAHVAAVHTHARAATFDKTRFLLHLGAAAFLVHYIYKKYKEGKLGRFHIFTDIKAAAAALIGYHELKVAYSIAKGSNSKTLQLLIAPINGLAGAMSTAASKLKHGDTSTVSSLNSMQSSFSSLAGKNGYTVKDQQPSGFGGF